MITIRVVSTQGGVRNPLTVTRRPSALHFIVEVGGTTRLVAEQQLSRETGAAQFHQLRMLFRPWRVESPVLMAPLIDAVRRFAALASIAHWLRVHVSAPRGYCMDALPLPVDEEASPPVAQRAWWRLALLAGQRDARAHGNPADLTKSFVSDTALLHWLIEPHDATAGAFWKVLTLVRKSGVRVADAKRLGQQQPARANT